MNAYLGLDRDALVEDYTRHVQRHIEPEVETLRELIRAEDGPRLTDEWKCVAQRRLAPWDEFVALSRDAFLYLLSEPDRLRWDLDPTRMVAFWEARALAARPAAPP